jgi:hypothetical protein
LTVAGIPITTRRALELNQSPRRKGGENGDEIQTLKVLQVRQNAIRGTQKASSRWLA